MSLVTNEQILAAQVKHGIAPHKHTNGLMSCHECVCAVVFDKTPSQLSEEDGNTFAASVYFEFLRET